ncbi:MAG: thiamine phosphate synthase [Gemmatimonadota bacterium]
MIVGAAARDAIGCRRPLPRLHLVTDDGILSAASFSATARSLIEHCGAELALHLRGHATPAARLHAAADTLAAAAAASGATLFVNDRIDIAIAAGTDVQLGARSLPPAAARALIGAGACIGYSAHAVAEAIRAAEDGADFVIVGTIWSSASHVGRAPAGVDVARECAGAAGVPVLGIGGVTPDRMNELAAAGAHGAAVLSGVWRAADPAAAALEYVAAARSAWTAGRGQQE